MSAGTRVWLVAVAALWAVLPAGETLAQVRPNCDIANGNNILDCVVESFRQASRSWETRLREFATRLFWLLALIEFTWASMQLAFKGADVSEWASMLLNQVLFIGFFAALLQFSADWARAIVDSFRSAANAASGTTLLRPSDIFDVGVSLASSILGGGSYWNVPHNLVLAIAAFFLVIAFGLIAASLIVALIESYFVISAGVLFMGFGASRWTKDYAVRTFQYCLSVGAKLFVIQLLAGLLIAIVQPWASVAESNSTLSQASVTSILVLTGVSVIFAVITRVIPEMVQALINGTSLMSGAGLYGSAANIATGTTVAAASGSMAVTSAAQLASEQLRSADSTGTGPAAPMGRAAHFASSTVGNLAAAAFANLGDRLGGRTPPHGVRMGQMATAMDRQRAEMATARTRQASATAPSASPPTPANDNPPKQ